MFHQCYVRDCDLDGVNAHRPDLNVFIESARQGYVFYYSYIRNMRAELFEFLNF